MNVFSERCEHRSRRAEQLEWEASQAVLERERAEAVAGDRPPRVDEIREREPIDDRRRAEA